MKDDRGVLLVGTARGMEPVDRQRFAAGFLACHEKTRMLGDGLAHAFSPTHVSLRHSMTSPEGTVRIVTEHIRGWAPYCASGVSLGKPLGTPCPLENVTCVACMAGLFQ